jgi:hypothetical protein
MRGIFLGIDKKRALHGRNAFETEVSGGIPLEIVKEIALYREGSEREYPWDEDFRGYPSGNS